MNRLIVAGAVALIAVSSAACGRMADLEAPPKRKTERAMRSGDGPGLPDPAEIYRPSSIQPIDGGPSNPYSGPGSVPGPR